MAKLAKETIDHDIDPLASIHYVDLKPHVNSYTHELVQIEWHVAVHGADFHLLKLALGPSKKFQQ